MSNGKGPLFIEIALFNLPGGSERRNTCLECSKLDSKLRLKLSTPDF